MEKCLYIRCIVTICKHLNVKRMNKAEPISDFKKCIEAAEARVKQSLKSDGKPYAAYCGVSDGLMMLLGLTTGYRVSDLLGVRRCDISLMNSMAGDRLELVPHMMIKEGKTQKTRTVPIHNYIYEYVKRQGEALADCPEFTEFSKIDELPIFYNPRTGKHFTRVWVNKRLALIMPKRLNKGRAISPHSLRKGFALNIYEYTGKDINAVRRILNHSTTRVTQVYLNLPDEQQSSVILAATLI